MPCCLSQFYAFYIWHGSGNINICNKPRLACFVTVRERRGILTEPNFQMQSDINIQKDFESFFKYNKLYVLLEKSPVLPAYANKNLCEQHKKK